MAYSKVHSYNVHKLGVAWDRQKISLGGNTTLFAMAILVSLNALRKVAAKRETFIELEQMYPKKIFSVSNKQCAQHRKQHSCDNSSVTACQAFISTGHNTPNSLTLFGVKVGKIYCDMARECPDTVI